MYELIGSILTGVAVITFFYGPDWIVRILTFPHGMLKSFLGHRETMIDKKIKLAQLEAKNIDE